MPEPDILLEAESIVTPGVWTDITNRVLYGEDGSEVTVDTGRQTELADIDPSRLGASLRNDDGALNPRNPTSPYPNWEPGRRLRLTETVGGVDFPLVTGYLETPEVRIHQPNLKQPVTVSAVDIMGRLDSAPKFESTLTEQIRAQSTGLVEWFPLHDPRHPFQSALTTVQLQRAVGGFFDLPVPKEPDELLQAAAADGPPGDDSRYALWRPAPDAEGDAYLGEATLEGTLSIPVGTDQVLAVSVWVRADTPDPVPTGVQPSSTILSVAGSNTSIALVDDISSSFTLYSRVIGDTSPFTDVSVLVGRMLERDVWRLITATHNYSTGVCEIWVGSDVAASATLSASADADTITSISLGSLWVGAIAHAQIRLGDANTFTRAMHIAQHQHGYQGLQRQTVAQRITTLAGYAGVPAEQLNLTAAASTPMQVAKLAGVGPAEAIRDAARTGQDTVIVDGQGLITLVPRSARYGQPVTLQIPFGWLERGSVKHRPDRALNDITVNIANGGTTRRVDRTSQLARGVGTASVTLDSAIDADAPNLAAWMLRTFNQTRTRISLMRINMLHRTTAQRQALLGLKEGDRIELTDVPDDSPDDLPHLIVQGRKHIIGPGQRRFLELRTSPLLGPSPGVPPQCPRVGDLVGSSAIVAY